MLPAMIPSEMGKFRVILLLECLCLIAVGVPILIFPVDVMPMLMDRIIVTGVQIRNHHPPSLRRGRPRNAALVGVHGGLAGQAHEPAAPRFPHRMCLPRNCRPPHQLLVMASRAHQELSSDAWSALPKPLYHLHYRPGSALGCACAYLCAIRCTAIHALG